MFFLYSKSILIFGSVRSLGISIITGPGRPVVAMMNAFLNVSAIDSLSLIRKLCLQIGLVIPVASAS